MTLHDAILLLQQLYGLFSFLGAHLLLCELGLHLDGTNVLDLITIYSVIWYRGILRSPSAVFDGMNEMVTDQIRSDQIRAGNLSISVAIDMLVLCADAGMHALSNKRFWSIAVSMLAVGFFLLGTEASKPWITREYIVAAHCFSAVLHYITAVQETLTVVAPFTVLLHDRSNTAVSLC